MEECERLENEFDVAKQTSSTKLAKNAKGIYTWEIKCYGDDLNENITEIRNADTRLTKLYGDELNPPQEEKK